jgi:arylformamidase
MIDISLPIRPGAVVYPGDPPLAMGPIATIGSDGYRLTQLGWTTHFLTHFDPPAHFLANGATIDEIPLARFHCPAVVVPVEGPSIEPEHVPEDVAGKAVLFRTTNSARLDATEFLEDHVYVSGAAAQALADRRANLVGIDYLDVDRFGDEDFPAHRILLANDVLILEGLDLRAVEPGEGTLIAFPLRIAAGDGSPTRAVFIPR